MRDYVFEKGKVKLWMPNVEDKMLGISLTEKDGLEMRRVCTEIEDIEEIKKLHAFLGKMIASVEAP